MCVYNVYLLHIAGVKAFGFPRRHLRRRRKRLNERALKEDGNSRTTSGEKWRSNGRSWSVDSTARKRTNLPKAMSLKPQRAKSEGFAVCNYYFLRLRPRVLSMSRGGDTFLPRCFR